MGSNWTLGTGTLEMKLTGCGEKPKRTAGNCNSSVIKRDYVQEKQECLCMHVAERNHEFT